MSKRRLRADFHRPVRLILLMKSARRIAACPNCMDFSSHGPLGTQGGLWRGHRAPKSPLDQWNCETPTFGDGESKRNSSAAASSDMGGWNTAASCSKAPRIPHFGLHERSLHSQAYPRCVRKIMAMIDGSADQCKTCRFASQIADARLANEFPTRKGGHC